MSNKGEKPSGPEFPSIVLIFVMAAAGVADVGVVHALPVET
jgi:hypothetical protein